MADAAKKKTPAKKPAAETQPEAPQAEPKPAKKAPLYQMSPSRANLREQAYNHFVVMERPDISIEQIMDERYLTHMAMQLNPADIIEVHAEDMSWEVWLRVVAVGKQFVQTRELHAPIVQPKPLRQREASAYTPKYRGGVLKWCVLRGSDVIKEGLVSEQEAIRWIVSHEAATER